jgi:Aspartyl protease
MLMHRIFASVSFATIFLTPLMAAPHCPGKVASLSMRIIQGSMIVVPLQINGSGPYDFLVDTGAQISTVDLSLASELRLKVRGTTGISGAGTYGRHDFAYLDQLQTGSKSVSDVLISIQDLAQLRAADPRIRGILGDNFLEHFDLLIDNRQHILCLDDSNALALAAQGEHVALIEPYGPANDLPFTRPIVVTAKVSGLVETPVLLRLDSGSNAAMLHVASPQMRAKIDRTTPTLKREVEGVEQVFALLPGQNLEIGKHHFHEVPFAVPMNSVGTGPSPREDGVLPTIAFQRIFISSAAGYAAFEPW